MRGRPRHDTRPHVRLHPSFLGIVDLTTNVFIPKLGGSIMCLATVHTFNSCTSRPNLCQWLVIIQIIQAHLRPTLLANQGYFQFWGYPWVYAQDTGWQSGVRSCIMPRLPTHLVQELYIGTVISFGMLSMFFGRSGTGRCPVDWCWNQAAVLYTIDPPPHNWQ